MISQFNRVFVSDGSVLTDVSIKATDYKTDAFTWDCQNPMYISSYLPFNNKYFDIKVANDQTLDLKIWSRRESSPCTLMEE